jgi:hypothetical protein
MGGTGFISADIDKIEQFEKRVRKRLQNSMPSKKFNEINATLLSNGRAKVPMHIRRNRSYT